MDDTDLPAQSYDDIAAAMIRHGENEKLYEKAMDPDDPYNGQDARSGKGA